jgi:protein-S-isoprenylcysteine O-methyltransferase Ste14
MKGENMTENTALKPADHAGVWVPPPLIYGVIFGLGLLLHQIVPLTIPPALPTGAVGLFFLGGGVLLLVWSNVLFQRAHTSLVPIKPTAALVMSGPYQRTRNPMYLGLLCVYIGVAFWFGLAWALFLVPLVVLAVQSLAIAKEEHYLEHRFGDAYRQYRTRVRRWI